MAGFVASGFGLVPNDRPVVATEDHSRLKEKTSASEKLYFNDAMALSFDDSLIGTHYSHHSHQSHYSHQSHHSHQSHYSHYSSYY
jgi:hypothetical protein